MSFIKLIFTTVIWMLKNKLFVFKLWLNQLSIISSKSGYSSFPFYSIFKSPNSFYILFLKLLLTFGAYFFVYAGFLKLDGDVNN